MLDLALRIRGSIRKPIEHLAAALPMTLGASVYLLKHLAFDAAERGDDETALSRWQELADRRPDWGIVYSGKAGTLRRLNRYDDAEQTLLQGIEKFPADIGLKVEFGWLLLDRNELNRALPIWRQVAASAPYRPECHVGLATTLRQLLCFDDADAVLTAATVLFPRSCFVFSNHAVTADVRGDRLEALKRWQIVLERFPNKAIAYAGVGAAFKMLGRFAEADRIMEVGLRKFPGDANVAINHAWVAVAAADWPEAIRRWNSLRSKWPGDARIKTGLSEALMQAGLAAADAAEDPGQSVSVATPDTVVDASYRALMMGFESIGENCELGFVQRHFDAEPLDLFRWAGIAYHKLLEALQNDFAGIGTDENTVLEINPNNQEYYTEDRRYGMSMHSFILQGDVPAATIKNKLCRRIIYLREKFLNDLRSDCKIFVFNAAQALSDDALRQLHDGLNRYGPVLLLHVAPHADMQPGTVAEIDTRLWRGSLPRTGFNGRAWNIDFDSWLTICRTVKQLAAKYNPGVAA